MFPQTAVRTEASGAAAEQPCHESGSKESTPSVPGHADCCVRPLAGQTEFEAVQAPLVMTLEWSVRGADPVFVGESVAGDGDFFAKYRHRHDLLGVVMRD
ncbi:MAG: hypothetical protein WCT10_05280 [Patescibacteria group bacterium]